MTRKPVTVWAVYQHELKIWSDGDLVAEIPSTQWHRLIRDLSDQFWSNQAEMKESEIEQEKKKEAIAVRSLDDQPKDETASAPIERDQRTTTDLANYSALGDSQ